MNEVTTIDNERSAPMSAVQPVSFLQIISDAVRTGNVDVVNKLIDANERMRKFEEERQFKQAFVEMWPLLPQITKDGRIELKDKEGRHKGTTRFARFEDIMDDVKPILAAHGFALSFRDISKDASMVVIEGELMHKDGHSKFGTKCLPPDHGAGRSNVQALGSSDSYAQRYITCDLLNLVRRNADDDGNSAKRHEQAQSTSKDARSLAEQARAGDFNRKKAPQGQHPAEEETWIEGVERRIAEAPDSPSRLDVVGKAALEAKTEDDLTLLARSTPIRKLAETPDNKIRIQAFLTSAKLRIAGPKPPPLTGQFDIYDIDGHHIDGPFLHPIEFAETFCKFMETVPVEDWTATLKVNEVALAKARKDALAAKTLAKLESPA